VIEAGERAAMEKTLRAALGDSLANAGARADADSDAVLAKLGWRELLAEEPGDAIAVVFSALGATNATASALDDVLATALGQQAGAELAVLLPRFARWDPPGGGDARELRAEGLAGARVAGARELLAVGGPASDPWLARLPRQSAELRAVRGIDPDAGLHTVRVQGGAAPAVRLDSSAWRSAVALGRRAVAHQIAGACRAMLELARTHALERTQFGRPIASFQAVRHRLADALVAVEALEAALDAAREQPDPDTAALAKGIAGRSAQTVAAHCQQVLAGIGFTAEHAFHRYAKRVLALEGLFGSADAIALDLGRGLLAARRVPTRIEL